MKKKPAKKKTDIRKLTHDQLPASVGLVKEVREELRAEIRSVRHDLNSKIESVNSDLSSKIESVNSDLNSKIESVRHDLNSKIESVRHDLSSKIESVNHDLSSKIESVRHELGSKIELVTVAVHRTQVLMEEQRNENKIVLDGLKSVIDRQDRFETDLVNLRDTVKTIKTVF